MVITNQNYIPRDNRMDNLKALIKMALAGDQNSYKQFLLQISKIIRAVIAKKIPSADVEDVVQEVLISIHKARHTYDCGRPLMPWLMAITSFRINDYLRKHYTSMRHKILDIDEFSDILTAVTSEPSGRELVNEMLTKVNEKQQKILTMMYVTGYSPKEIGKMIGMNESAVKVAAHRAVKKIKEKFPKL